MKPHIYDIKPNSYDSHQQDPYWLAVVVPLKYKDTYNRDNQFPSSITESEIVTKNTEFIISSDFVGLDPTPVRTIFKEINPVDEDPLIIIDDDCISWQVSSSKESHVSGLSMTLLFSSIDYSNAIAPQDWILFWAFDNFSDYQAVKAKVTSSPVKRANEFATAPKFLGRVSTVFRNKRVDPATGRATISYSLTASGFSELDSSMYFDQTIELLRADASNYWADFRPVEFQNESITAGLVSGQDAVPFLFKICMGTGPGEGAKTGFLGGETKITPNDSYLVPKTVIDLITGSTEPSIKRVGFTYVDLMKMFIGTFQYGDKSFVPAINTSNNRIFQGPPISGIFPVQPLNFNNQSVWSILETYVGRPMNEMYTCLRVDEEGFVVPTLVVRQNPLSSNRFVMENSGTAFLSLPRWNISDEMVTDISVGRSDTLRHNYMHIIPMNHAANERIGKEVARFYGEPIVDAADIKRSGLRAMIKTVGNTFVPTTNVEAQEMNRFYNKLMADILFGSHLKFTGSIALKGVQAPICEGDNCVVDGVVYHIERITHSGSIDSSGKRMFDTSLQVINGISISSDANNSFIIYPGGQEDSHIGSNFEVEK